MNQTTTNFSLTNTTHDETEIPIEFRNYVTFVKRQREESDLTASWQDDETPPSTPPSEEDMTSPTRDNTENDTQEESSSNPEPVNDKGKSEHEGSSSNLLLEPVHPSTWQSRHHHQPDECDPLDWGRGKIKSNYSPPRTQPYRSGLCQFCDEPMGSQTHKSTLLTCHACRTSFQEHTLLEIQTQQEKDQIAEELATTIPNDTMPVNDLPALDMGIDILVLPQHEEPQSPDPASSPTHHQLCTRINYSKEKIAWQQDNDTTDDKSEWHYKDGLTTTHIPIHISPHPNPFHTLHEIQDEPITRQKIQTSLTHLGLYSPLNLTSRWTTHLLAYQRANLKMKYKRNQKQQRKLLRAIRFTTRQQASLPDTPFPQPTITPRQEVTDIAFTDHLKQITRDKRMIKQSVTRFTPTIIPESPPPMNEEYLTIRLIFPGRELSNQDFITPPMITIDQLTQRITALFTDPSLITNILLYVRPVGPTWIPFQRPGSISNTFLPGELIIPCASLENGTNLRVIPYFIPCQEDKEEENNSGEEYESYKEDPWYHTHDSDEDSQTYQYENPDYSSSDSDSSLRIHQASYIRPEYGESSAESAERQQEINTRITDRINQRTKRREQRQQRKQCVQELTLDDINPFGLYENPIKP